MLRTLILFLLFTPIVMAQSPKAAPTPKKKDPNEQYSYWEDDLKSKEDFILFRGSGGSYMPFLRVVKGKIGPSSLFDLRSSKKKMFEVPSNFEHETELKSTVVGADCSWSLITKSNSQSEFLSTKKDVLVTEPTSAERTEFESIKKDCSLTETPYADGPNLYECIRGRVGYVSDLNKNGMKEYWIQYTYPHLVIEEYDPKEKRFARLIDTQTNYEAIVRSFSITSDSFWYLPEDQKEALKKSMAEQGKKRCQSDSGMYSR